MKNPETGKFQEQKFDAEKIPGKHIWLIVNTKDVWFQSVCYCINGIARGYLNFSPLDTFMLAITMHIIFNRPRNTIIGIPTRIKHNGITSTM